MRNVLRLALVTAVAAVALPTAPANAILCDPLIEPACRLICEVNQELGRPCPR